MAVLTVLSKLILVVISIQIKDVLAEEVCGHAHGMLSGKIVGGYAVGYYKYPWFVSLTQADSPVCGATLISSTAVVTAAHCFDQHMEDPSELPNVYVLKIGAYNICDTSEVTQKTFHVDKVYIHERYKQEDPFFDIAMLILKEPADFEPACLPAKPLDSSTRPWEGVVTGFGVLKFQSMDTSCVQREARVRIYNDTVCKDMIKKVDEKVTNFQHAFCAGYLEGGVDACQGDSGGPLMVLQSGSRVQLLGITSFGYKCAMKDLLGVYTDVSHFLDWIKEKSNPSAVTESPATSQQPVEETEATSNENAISTTVETTEVSSVQPEDTTTEENNSDGGQTKDSNEDDEDDSDEQKKRLRKVSHVKKLKNKRSKHGNHASNKKSHGVRTKMAHEVLKEVKNNRRHACSKSIDRRRRHKQ